MKKLALICIIIGMASLVHAQELSASMDKVETLKFINSILKPEGNLCNLSSISTKLNYTENFFSLATRKVWDLDLRQVNIVAISSGVTLKCKTGNCIQYTFSSPEKEEKTQVSELVLKSDRPADLYKAFVQLKRRVGL